jgi:hypothetical protein
MGHRLLLDSSTGRVMSVVAEWGNGHDVNVTGEGDRPDRGPSPVERRGKHPWWLISARSGLARFGAWLWLLLAGVAIVQLLITQDHVVRWIAGGQVVIGLCLSASYFGSLRYTRRAEGHRPRQQ